MASVVQPRPTYGEMVMGSSAAAPPSSRADLIFPEEFHSRFNDGSRSGALKKSVERNGRASIPFSNEDIESFAEPLRFILVIKFLGKIPKLHSVKMFLASLKLQGSWTLGYLDGRHLMLKVSKEEDYCFLFTRSQLQVEGINIRFLKWTVNFDTRIESPVAAIWLSFPHLRLHFFHREALYAIAAAFGKPLQIDRSTLTMSKPSVARVLVERDISLPLPEEVFIGTDENGYWQRIVVEKVPYYCKCCKVFGHTLERCYFAHPELRKKPRQPSSQGDYNGNASKETQQSLESLPINNHGNCLETEVQADPTHSSLVAKQTIPDSATHHGELQIKAVEGGA